MKKIPVRPEHTSSWHRPPESSWSESRKERQRVTALWKGLVRRNEKYFMDNVNAFHVVLHLVFGIRSSSLTGGY